MEDVGTRYCQMTLIHPVCFQRFSRLKTLLEQASSEQGMPYVFRPFETYRSPTRQSEMVRRKTSKAGPWTSPHQYGFAVDFVPRYPDGKWSWDDNHDWGLLRSLADACELEVPIRWDLAHVEAPEWKLAKMALRQR